MGPQDFHIIQTFFLIQEVDDFDVIVDLFDGGIGVVHEVIGSVDVLAAESVFDCLHFQDDGVAEVFLAFLEQFSHFVPLSDHFLYLFFKEGVVFVTVLGVTVDAEAIEWGNQLINAAHSMPPVLFHHTLLAAFAIKGTGIVEADVFDGLVAVSFSLVAEVFGRLT